MYAVQVVISPHVYGPSISLTTNDDAGTALWTRLSQSFGYLNLAGYGGHRFPIAIGEFGTTFAETADQVLFADLARYLLNVQADGTPVDALHNPITSFFWFAWNANSGDTGGLVTSPNWDSIVWQKIEYLQGLGLAPWYTGAAPSTVVVGGSTTAPVATIVPVPAANNSSNASVPVATTAAVNATPVATSLPTNTTPAVTVAPTNSTPAATNSTPSVTAAPTNITPTVTVIPANTTPAATNSTPVAAPAAISSSPATNTTPAPVPVPSATNFTPKSTPATTAATVTPVTTPTPSPAAQVSCSVAASYSDYWIDPSNGPYMTSISLFITNTANEVIAIPWSIEISSTQYTAVEYTWNWQIGSGYDGSSVSGTASYAWQNLQPQGGTVTLGWVTGSAQTTTFLPSSVSINGHICAWA